MFYLIPKELIPENIQLSLLTIQAPIQHQLMLLFCVKIKKIIHSKNIIKLKFIKIKAAPGKPKGPIEITDVKKCANS